MQIMPTLSKNPSQPSVTAEDLSSLKKRVLKQAYDLQIKESKRKNHIFNPEYSNLDTNRYSLSSRQKIQRSKDSYSQNRVNNNKDYENNLQKQMSQKSNTNKQILDQMIAHQTLQQEYQKRVKNQYKQCLLEEIKRKELQRSQRKQSQRQGQASLLNRNTSLNHKKDAFSQYFQNVNTFRDNVTQQYLQYLNNKKARNLQHKNEQREYVARQQFLMNFELQQQMKIKNQRKNELKQALQRQMQDHLKSRQQKSNQNRRLSLNTQQSYNTIINPIDYKMDVNNRYVINQLSKNYSHSSLGHM